MRRPRRSKSSDAVRCACAPVLIDCGQRQNSRQNVPCYIRGMRKSLAFLGLACSLCAFGQQEDSPGAKIYAQQCASCHESGAPRMPTRAALQQQTSSSIAKTLASGLMKEQGSKLSMLERLQVAGWLGRKTALGVDSSRLANMCSSVPDSVGTPQAEWISWGGSLSNARFQPAKAAGLAASDVSRLKLKWAFAVPDASGLRSQPVVNEGRLLFTGAGMVYSLDARSGCTQWATELPVVVHSAIVVGSPAGATLAYMGDQAGNVYALNVRTGVPAWQAHVDAHPTAIVTGTPAYYQGKLYVPVASYEELAVAQPGYFCCTFRGSIVALDAATGKKLWQTFTVEEAKTEHTNKSGVKTVGPSGASIWSAPTIDVEKGLLYAATGDNFSDPSTDSSDAVIAMALDTGKIVWSKQFRSGDAYNVGCNTPDKKSCPDANGPDFDFGASPILATLSGGKRLLVLAQKSGAVYAVDPDERGKLVWQSQLGKGGTLGGVEFGPAADASRLFVAISDEAFTVTAQGADLDPSQGGGLFAFQLSDGKRLWETPAPPCDAARHPCSPAQPGAVTATPDLVFSGSLDGHLRAYSTSTGKILWDYDTEHEYKAVNGAPGHGGSLNVAGPVIAGGKVYALSGYDQFGAAPGNVLLAFTVDGK